MGQSNQEIKMGNKGVWYLVDEPRGSYYQPIGTDLPALLADLASQDVVATPVNDSLFKLTPAVQDDPGQVAYLAIGRHDGEVVAVLKSAGLRP